MMQYLKNVFQSSYSIFGQKVFRASDWTAKTPQHGSKQIRGIQTLQGYMLLL